MRRGSCLCCARSFEEVKTDDDATNDKNPKYPYPQRRFSTATVKVSSSATSMMWNLPIHSKVCPHTICALCFIQMEEHHQPIRLGGGLILSPSSSLKASYQCPCCWKRGAFPRQSLRRMETSWKSCTMALLPSASFRWNLLQVHRQPWTLDWNARVSLMARLHRPSTTTSSTTTRRDPSSSPHRSNRLVLHRQRKEHILSATVLYDLIRGAAQVGDFSQVVRQFQTAESSSSTTATTFHDEVDDTK